MTITSFVNQILTQFQYTPTQSQVKLIHTLSEFLYHPNENSLFVLKGYAGTGKTSLVSLFVNNLYHLNKKSVLLAPTGRAAKVFSGYSGKKAFTIHKKIYLFTTGPDGNFRLILSENKSKDTVFMVDEASMIPDDISTPDFGLFSTRSLLNDLISYAYNGKGNRLVLIGDTAQLPPVGMDESPALNIDYLKNSFHLNVTSYEMKEVVRQSLESGILANATNLRKKLHDNKGLTIQVNNYPDLQRITGNELEDVLNTAYSNSGTEETIIITRSNKRANVFNQEIRNRILFMENEISSGDHLMIVKNNYFWIDKNSGPGFLANGDIIQIQRIDKYETFYGFRFADVTVKLLDYPNENKITVKIILDTLMSEGPSLSQKKNQQLFEEILKDYEDIPSRRKKIEQVKNSPFYNALQVKFAYALTCHKTQGGQWETVFIDQGYLTEAHINKEYYRWLYTAFTRATKKLYLVNFHERFFA
ncbi:MAG: AAA family ATPase [Bacteroidales bacterium]|nr:AAA family ATPase [Bacteroidales bacterium]